MAPSAAFGFLLNEVAQAMLDIKRSGARPAWHLGLIALFLSLLVALGQAYQTSPLQKFILAEGWPEATLMAMIFVALSIRVVCAPQKWPGLVDKQRKRRRLYRAASGAGGDRDSRDHRLRPRSSASRPAISRRRPRRC